MMSRSQLGKKKNQNWDCDEEASHCFTLFSATVFFFAGGTMCVFAGLYLFDGATSIAPVGAEILDVTTVMWGMFVFGILIACAAQIGMVTAACAKCAANPDGENDECEQCCTTIISGFYIALLSIIILGSIVIGGALSYYYAAVVNVDNTVCPYPEGDARRFVTSLNSVLDNTPDESCVLDFAMYKMIFEEATEESAAAWYRSQQVSLTCGYHCDNGNYCSPNLGPEYTPQTTGPYCTQNVTFLQPQTAFTVYEGEAPDGTPLEYTQDAPSTMAFRPTMYSVFSNFLLPFLITWWLIAGFSILLILAALSMCIRRDADGKAKTKYKAQKDVDDRYSAGHM